MKRIRCLRPTALLLTVLLLLVSIPVSTNAVPTLSEESPSSVEAESGLLLTGDQTYLSDERAGGIREVTELREENVKHFALTNGKYTAVSYAAPVHRKDASGAWQDIDNSLALTTVKGSELYATDDLRVIFAKEFAAGAPLFSLNENGYGIGMSFISNQLDASASVTPIGTTALTNHEARESTTYYDTFEEASRIDNRSSIVYTNVKANTDLEYVLDGNNVKENIIVKSAGTSYVYRFALSLSGLTATLTDAGDIALTDSTSGEEQYVIPAPYMYDANGEVSYDVAYTLTETGVGAYTLTVTASTDWINADGRAFPVTIDPTVIMSSYFLDTYIMSTTPAVYYNSALTLRIASNTVAYVMFAMPTVPDNGIIVNADLYMMPVSVSSGSVTVGAYQMTEQWYPSSINWNTASSTMTNFGMSSTQLSSTVFSTATHTAIDVMDAATAWYAGTSTNYGVALKYLSGNATSMLLHSDEAESAQQPYFTVEYVMLQDGCYFIQNAKTERYMDVEGPSTAAGAIIQQWDYHGHNQSKWNITYVSDGYFRIQSVYSGLYVGVDSSNTSVIKQYNSLNDYTLRKIQKTSTENHKFTCKATESTGKVLSVPASANSNGTNLTQSTYTKDTDHGDEWYIVYKVISYVNYYDSTFINTEEYRENIALANSFANLVYSRYFHVGIYMDGAASLYDTIADECTIGTNKACTDACGTDCRTSHHKNVYNISDQIYNEPREDDHIYVLWTARYDKTYCEEKSNVHSPVSALALVCNSRPVIHVLSISGPTINIRLALMTITLVHETAHTLRMGDVAGEGHDVEGEYICVMEEFERDPASNYYQNIISGEAEPFCPSCMTAMQGYTSNISINGN